MVKCTGLENRQGFTPLVSSNLTASASSPSGKPSANAPGVDTNRSAPPRIKIVLLPMHTHPNTQAVVVSKSEMMQYHDPERIQG